MLSMSVCAAELSELLSADELPAADVTEEVGVLPLPEEVFAFSEEQAQSIADKRDAKRVKKIDFDFTEYFLCLTISLYQNI